MISPIAEITRGGLWKGRLQSTWQTLQSEGFGSRSPFPFPLYGSGNVANLSDGRRLQTRIWGIGRIFQNVSMQSHTTDRRQPANILERCWALFRNALLSPSLSELMENSWCEAVGTGDKLRRANSEQLKTTRQTARALCPITVLSLVRFQDTRGAPKVIHQGTACCTGPI